MKLYRIQLKLSSPAYLHFLTPIYTILYSQGQRELFTLPNFYIHSTYLQKEQCYIHIYTITGHTSHSRNGSKATAFVSVPPPN